MTPISTLFSLPFPTSLRNVEPKMFTIKLHSFVSIFRSLASMVRRLKWPYMNFTDGGIQVGILAGQIPFPTQANRPEAAACMLTPQASFLAR